MGGGLLLDRHHAPACGRPRRWIAPHGRTGVCTCGRFRRCQHRIFGPLNGFEFDRVCHQQRGQNSRQAIAWC